MDGLSDSLFVDSRVEVNQHAGWLFLRRLELPSLALLGHFRGLLAINRVNTTPLLDPFVCWLRCFDDASHGYKFLVSCGEKFEQFDFLFGIKLRTQRSIGHKLKGQDQLAQKTINREVEKTYM